MLFYPRGNKCSGIVRTAEKVFIPTPRELRGAWVDSAHRSVQESGERKMETKSRYEVIADLERQKRQMIQDRGNLDEGKVVREKAIKDLKRQVEDKEEDLTNYIKSIDNKKEIIDEMLKSIDDALKRFDSYTNSGSQKK